MKRRGMRFTNWVLNNYFSDSGVMGEIARDVTGYYSGSQSDDYLSIRQKLRLKKASPDDLLTFDKAVSDYKMFKLQF